MELVAFIVQIADFLNTVIFQSSFIYLNLWSILHLTSGYLIVKYYLKSGDLHKLFFLLVLYEMFEMLTIYLGFGLFRAEIPQDILWDLLIGLIGGYIAVKNL